MPEPITIVVTRRTADIHACLKDHPEIWGCGRGPAEAIGEVIRSHPERFGLAIEYPGEPVTRCPVRESK